MTKHFANDFHEGRMPYDDDKILYFEFDQVKQKKHIIKNEKLKKND